MSWWNPLSWSRSDLAAAPQVPVVSVGGVGPNVIPQPGQGSGASPDLEEFARSTWSLSTLGIQDVVALGAIGAGCTPATRAEFVPLEIKDLIARTDPVVYTMLSVVTGPAKDPELYYLRCDDKKLVPEVEAWLRPLLTKQRAPLLAQICRAFAMGSVPIVLDYVSEDLAWEQERGGAGGSDVSTFRRTAKGHVHYARSHEVWPGEASLRVDGDRLLGLIYSGQEYGGEDLDDPGRARAFLSIWDPSYGRWGGQGAIDRVYKDWLEGGMARLWEMRALERVVDPARIGYAPNRDIEIGGQKISAVKLLRAQMLSLRNGSVMTLPGEVDGNGNALWRVEAPFTPGQGHEIAKQAIDARDVRKAWACLSPGGPVDKASEEQFMDSIQSVCDFAAATLTRMVNVCVKVTHGPAAPFVQVIANDIPKRKMRTVLEVFRATSSATQRMPDGRVYTLAELVDPEILDQLGIKARTVATAAHLPAYPESIAEAFSAPPSGEGGEKPVGRPNDTTSQREERRDNAETIEGEGDTGGEDVEREERPE